MTTFNDADLQTVQDYFHKLILLRNEPNTTFLEMEDKQLPVITEANLDTQNWFPVPGMYGGFNYHLEDADNEPVLVSESWVRVAGGSGQKHRITKDGVWLVENQTDFAGYEGYPKIVNEKIL